MNVSTSNCARAATQSTITVSQRLAVAALAFSIGAMLVFAAGFAETAAAHDAAHDTRHSLAFPCH